MNEQTPPPSSSSSWQDLGISPELLDLLKKAKFERPTPVQEKTIPLVLQGRDLIVSAQTGTGKTAAFVLPMIEKLKGREGTYGLVLAPSREIALQTQVVLEQFGTPMGIRSASLIGGVPLRQDDIALQNYPQVLVATPGRLCDHLDRGNLWLDYLEYVVLDEADRMLDMGFSDQLQRILVKTPKSRQTLLLSATMPPNVEQLGRRILSEPERISIGKPVSAATTVEQNFIFTDEKNKLRELRRIFDHEPGSIFIFTKSKDRTSRLWHSLHRLGIYDATHLHSGLRQSDREKSLEDFKAGKYRIMIATDVIGRGIHVDGVAHVVNYDLPRDASDYVHRIGRTGRALASGKATSFVTATDRQCLAQIEKLLNRKISPSTEGGDHSPRGAKGGRSRHDQKRPPAEGTRSESRAPQKRKEREPLPPLTSLPKPRS
jgi:ATP-dependent RNA helicase RhlE